jgi:hypothetical protein
MDVKGVGRRTHLFDDLRNRRRSTELKEAPEDKKKVETPVYHMNLRKKYSSTSPQTC